MKKLENMGAKSAFLMSLAAGAALAACGGGSSSSSTSSSSSASSSTLSGNAAKGPFQKGTYPDVTKVYCYPATGTKTSSNAVVTSITDNNGSYSCSVSFSGGVVVEVDGGYLDTDNNLQSTNGTGLKALTNVTLGTNNSVYPTVWSNLEAGMAIPLITAGTSVAAAKQSAAVAAYRGFVGDNNATLPFDPSTQDFSALNPFGSSTLEQALSEHQEKLQNELGTSIMTTLNQQVSDLQVYGQVQTANLKTGTALTAAQYANFANQGAGANSSFTISDTVRSQGFTAAVNAQLASSGYLPVNIYATTYLTASSGTTALNGVNGLFTMTQGLSSSSAVTATLGVSASASNGSVTLSSSTASISSSGTSSTSGLAFTYTPNNSTTASDTITLTATTDQGSSTAKALVNFVNVGLQNYPESSQPSLINVTTTANQSLSITATDADGDTLSYYIAGNMQTVSSGTTGYVTNSTGLSFTGGLTGLFALNKQLNGYTFSGATSSTTTGFGHWSIAGSVVTFEPAFSTTVTASLGYAVIDSKGYGVLQEFLMFNWRIGWY
jgi:hypothetical protein